MKPNFRMALAEEYRKMIAEWEHEKHRARIIPTETAWLALRVETCSPGYEGELM